MKTKALAEENVVNKYVALHRRENQLSQTYFAL